MAGAKPRIAVLAGPTATVLNSAPLVTDNIVRRRHGLPLLRDAWGEELRFGVLRPQRLARPVTVYVEQFSAHPLEREAAELYHPPDGYVNAEGEFHRDRRNPSDVPVYEIELRPEDGPLPLPYVARQRDGSAWDADCAEIRGVHGCRQPFYPDASRIFEEIDRLGLDVRGIGNQLTSQADYDFFRVLPSGGYPFGRPESERTDRGDGDIPPEVARQDYFPYRPSHLRVEPSRERLADVANGVQTALNSSDYLGALWLEGSPYIEETVYWLNLVVDTTKPLVGCPSVDWPHGVLGSQGDRSLIDSVKYICSSIWADESGRDRIGAVLVQSEQIFAARDVQKGDARPGGYVATGGHGGIVGTIGEPGPPVLTYVPVWRHTHNSELQIGRLPTEVPGVYGQGGSAAVQSVRIKDWDGQLLGNAIPFVSFHKHARFLATGVSSSPDTEVEILTRIERNLRDFPLAGFVVEGGSPFGSAAPSADSALLRATFSGMPVVRTGRGNAEGFVAHERVKLGVAGANLTATKARVLLIACLLRFGALPPAADPGNPTPDEVRATEQALVPFQQVFDRY